MNTLCGFLSCLIVFSTLTFAQSPLNFGNNFFVTGDYLVAGAYGMNTNFTTINGVTYAVGTISVPDANPGITGTKWVPPGGQIVAALLYWQTVEKVGVAPGGPGSGQNGYFRPLLFGGPAAPGYAISGTNITGNNTVSWSSGGCSGGSTGKLLRTYRADVAGGLPVDKNGNSIANGLFEIRLPSTGPSTPLTLGATLVVIYRVLSGAGGPNIPLNSIVIYDGDYSQNTSQLTMTQQLQGFYDADHNPVSRLTHIVGNGQSNKYQTVYLSSETNSFVALPSLYSKFLPAFPGWYGNWDNPTWTFPNANTNPVKEDSSYATTKVVPFLSNQGCVSWGAVIVSTTVKNSDSDGILDSWKKSNPPGYCDAAYNNGVCSGPGDPAWIGLPGATKGQKDVFLQYDYMCSAVHGPPQDPNNDNAKDDSCVIGGNNYSFDPRQAEDQLDGLNPHTNAAQKVVAAFNNHKSPGAEPVVLHAVPGNAIQESQSSCADTDVDKTGALTCPFPNEPGTVGFREGLAYIKNQTIEPQTGLLGCDPSSDPNCVAAFKHGKKDSYHYALFSHGVGLPNWFLSDKSIQSVSQSGNTVTFTTSSAHNLSPIAGDSLCSVAKGYIGRVTVVFAITNPNLEGTYCARPVGNPPSSNKFAIVVGGSSTTATYTVQTDPNLAVANGQVTSMSGYSDVGGQNSVISLGYGGWGPPQNVNPPSEGNKWNVKAGTFMHELGHTLALTHGGTFYNNLPKNDYTPTFEANCKPNVQSVMSYAFQFDLLQVPGQTNPADGSPLKVVDYSQDPPLLSPQLVPTLTESMPAGPNLLNALSYANTSWFQLSSYSGATPATTHCDGTPVGPNEKAYSYTNDAVSNFLWSSTNPPGITGNDINFDGNATEVMHPHNEWEGTPAANGAGPSPGVDLRQISAVGTISTIGLGGEAGGLKPAGGGGGLKPAGGGGGLHPAGGGGGLKPAGGGGLSAEITHGQANSYARPPQGLFIVQEEASPRFIDLSWFAASFGTAVTYNIYRAVTGGAFSQVGQVSGSQTTFQDSVTCNPAGYQYRVTAVALNDQGQQQQSSPSNTVPAAGQPLLTGCYTAPINVAVEANGVQGDIVPVTWTLTDDFYVTPGTGWANAQPGKPVTNLAASTLVANGPIPGNCGTVGPTKILSKGIPQSGASTFRVTPTGQFTFNWDTDPFCAGSYTFTLTLDSTQTQTSASALQLAIDVNDQDTPHITTLSLPGGVVGLAYSDTLTEDGGTAPLAWTVTGLPSGISQQPNSISPTLSGTACVAGLYNVTATVTDSAAPKPNYGTQGLTLKINQASTTTSVASSLNASTYGQAVTFTATVAPQYSCTPTGTVTFEDGGVAFAGSSTVALSGGMASFTTTALQLIAGTHSITAVYSGDSNFYGTGSNGSTATILSQTVNKAITTTSVVSSLNASTYGQSVTFTTVVTPAYAGTPTGTVTFEDGGVALAGSSTVALSGGMASFTTTALQLIAGTHSITAVYSGDSNFYATGTGGSTATPLTQTVNPAMTATSVSSSLNPSTYGDLVTFTAIVSNASSTAATPTGSVQFVIDSGSPVSGTPSACHGAPTYSLCATTSTSSLTVSGSPHTVQANYINADGDFKTSSGTLSQMVNPGQTVQKADTTATLAVSSGSSTLGDTVSLTATVIDASGGSTGTPTGLVTFLDGTTPIGTGALSGGASDQATFTTSLLSVGTHSLTVQYDGDANFNATGADAGSTAAGATETVALRGTTVGVALVPSTVVVGQPSTTTVTVTDSGNTNPVGTADSWIATSGTPTVGTSGSTATLFADGMVLVAGGLNSGAAVNNAYIYNAVSKTFTATGSLNTARTGATATLLANGEILIAGGSSDGTATNALNTAELYNPVTGAFTAAGSGSGHVMTAVRFGATATLLTNGQVLIAGGENSGGALSSAELYNFATDTFTATGSLGTARYDAAALLLANGSVLIAGGTGGSGTLNSAELYSAGTFASAGTMTAPRTGATATLLLNGNVLIAGGSTDTAEIYNLTTPAFTAISSTLSYAPVNGTATLLPNGMVLLAGGTSGQTTELYDPDSDKFDATGNLLYTDQPSLTATLLNKDHVLITGLTSGGSPVADAELYTPSFDPLGMVGLSSSDTLDNFGAACVLTISGGVSTCTSMVTPGEVGTSPHTITGTYPADSVHSGKTGSVSLTVNKASTMTTVNSVSPSPAFVGQPITVSYTFSVVAPGAGSPIPPSGNITVSASDGSSCMAAAVQGVGMCTLSPPPTTAGTNTFTITYAGDSNFVASGANGNYTVYQLVFTTQPSNTGVGLTMTPAVQVAAQDSSNNTLTTFTGSITLAIGSGPGTLSGTTTQSAVSGVATFGGLSINQMANAYTLVASLTAPAGATTVTSNAFNVDGVLFAGTDQNTLSGNPLPDQLGRFTINGTTTTSSSILSVPYHINGMAQGGNFLFAGDPISNTLQRIDFNGNVLSSVTAAFPITCCNADMAFDAANNVLWHANNSETTPPSGGEIDKLDPTTGALITTYPLSDVAGVTFVGNTIWITQWSAQEVGIWDPNTNTFTPKFSTSPANAGGLAYDPVNGILWVGLQGGSVVPYDLSGNPKGPGFSPFGAITDTVDGLEFVSQIP